MTHTKRKRRDTRCMFSMPFRKHGVVLLVTYMRIYKNGDIGDIKGMGSVHKGEPPQTSPWQNWKGLPCYPACCWHCCNRPSKGKILAERINVYTEHIKPSKSLPQACEGKWSEEEGSQRERYLGSAEAPACPTQRSAPCENTQRGTWAAGTQSLWVHGTISVKKTHKISRLYLKKSPLSQVMYFAAEDIHRDVRICVLWE